MSVPREAARYAADECVNVNVARGAGVVARTVVRRGYDKFGRPLDMTLRSASRPSKFQPVFPSGLVAADHRRATTRGGKTRADRAASAPTLVDMSGKPSDAIRTDMRDGFFDQTCARSTDVSSKDAAADRTHAIPHIPYFRGWSRLPVAVVTAESQCDAGNHALGVGAPHHLR